MKWARWAVALSVLGVHPVPAVRQAHAQVVVPVVEDGRASGEFLKNALAAERTCVSDISKGMEGALFRGAEPLRLPPGRYGLRGLLALTPLKGLRASVVRVAVSAGDNSRELDRSYFAEPGKFVAFRLDFIVNVRKPVSVAVTWGIPDEEAREKLGKVADREAPKVEGVKADPRARGGFGEVETDEEVDTEFIDTDSMVTLEEAAKFPCRLMGCGFHIERLSPVAVAQIVTDKAVYGLDDREGRAKVELWNYGLETADARLDISIHRGNESVRAVHSGRIQVPAQGPATWEGSFRMADLRSEAELRATVEVQGLEPASGGTLFCVYDPALAIGDLHEPSRNLLCNSNFAVRTVPTMPDYWGVSTRGDYQGRPARASVDPDGPFPGMPSLRLEPGLCLESFFHPRPTSQKLTFSCYLRSDTPGAKAELYLGRYYFEDEDRPRKEVMLSDRWQRYWLTGASPNNSWNALRSGVGVRSPDRGMVRMTAPQLEAGESPTPYQYSTFDRLARTRAKSVRSSTFELAPLPEANCATLAKAPKIDGQSEPGEWDGAAALGGFVDCYTAEKVEPRTEARIGRDEESLYVRFDCVEPAAKTSGFQWDLVGLVLALGPDTDAHSFLFVTRDGSKHWHRAWPLGACSNEWWSLGGRKPDWPVAVGATDSGWTVELAIPLTSDLLAAGDSSGQVRMNFFRSRRVLEDYMGDPWVSTYGLSAWSCTYGFVRNLPRCGTVRLFTEEELPLSGIAMLDSSWVWDGHHLTFSGILTSKSRIPRKVKVAVRSGGVPDKTMTQECAPTRDCPVRVCLSFDPAPGKFDAGAQVDVADIVTGRSLWRYSGSLPYQRSAPWFRVLTEYDFYTRETETVAIVESRTHEPLSVTAQLVRKGQRGGEPDPEAERSETLVRTLPGRHTLAPWGRAEIPIADVQALANGEYLLRVIGTTEQGAEFRSEAILRKCALNPSEVKISRHTLALEQNGRPFIGYREPYECSSPEFNVTQVGLDCRQYVAPGDSTANATGSRAGDVGNVAEPEPQATGGGPPQEQAAVDDKMLGEDMRALTTRDRERGQESLDGYLQELNRAQEEGKAAILHVRTPGAGKHAYTKAPEEEYLAPLLAASRHPAALATYYMDEPGSLGDSKESTLQEAYQLFKRVDPYHPAYLNWTGAYRRFRGAFGSYEATDIACWDEYPFTFWSGRGFEKGSVVGIARLTERMREDARSLGKALSFYLQIYGYECAYREPTPDEVRCMVYVCLVNGFRLIQFFYWRPQSDELLAALISISEELKLLEPALVDRGSREILYGIADHAIRYTVWRSPQGLHLLAVNPYPFPVQATLGLGSTAAPNRTVWQVLFENRNVEPSKGAIRDTFGPYERHVYQLVP